MNLATNLIVLNGPAGVGKTTVARRLCARVAHAVGIHGDEVRAFAPGNAAAFLGPGSTYRVAARMCASYLEFGAGLVVFEYVFECAGHVRAFTRDLPAAVRPQLVTLWAPLHVVVQRERQRAGRARLGARVVECHARMSDVLGGSAAAGASGELGDVLSTDRRSPDELAEALYTRYLAHLARACEARRNDDVP